MFHITALHCPPRGPGGITAQGKVITHMNNAVRTLATLWPTHPNDTSDHSNKLNQVLTQQKKII